MKTKIAKLGTGLGLMGLFTLPASAAATLPTEATAAFTDIASLIGLAGAAAIAIAVAWVLARVVLRAIKGFGK